MSYYAAILSGQGGGPELTSGFSDGVGSATGQATISAVGDWSPHALPNPRAHWRLDEITGTNAPDTGTANRPGTLFNAPAWVPGQLGNALDFESTVSQRVDFAAGVFSANTVQAFTLCAWIKPESYGVGSAGNIISWTNSAGTGSNLQLRLLNEAGQQGLRSFLSLTGSSAQSDAYNCITLGVFQHIAAVYNRAGDRILHLFVNGIEVSTSVWTDGSGWTDGTNWSDAIPSVGANANMDVLARAGRIGSEYATTQRYFDGVIDDVRVYEVALTPAEIAVVMLAGTGFLDGVGLAAGSSTVFGVGAPIRSGIGTVAGSATALGVGGPIRSGVGLVAGSSTAEAVGSSVSDSGEGDGLAGGSATVTAVGASSWASVGLAAGAATVSAVALGGPAGASLGGFYGGAAYGESSFGEELDNSGCCGHRERHGDCPRRRRGRSYSRGNGRIGSWRCWCRRQIPGRGWLCGWHRRRHCGRCCHNTCSKRR